MEDYFKAQFPYLDSQIADIKIEYINNDICSPSMRSALCKWSHDENRMLTVAICISDPDMSLSLGLNLPSAIYEREIPVLIRQKHRPI